MESVFNAYENMLVDQTAIEILESASEPFWKPSPEAVDAVRQEFVDKMMETPKDLKQFHKSFAQDIKDRALSMARQVDDWKTEGRYKWDKNDVVYSHRTGKTYQITGHSIGGSAKNRYPVYTYTRSDGDEKGTFNAEKAHETLKKIN